MGSTNLALSRVAGLAEESILLRNIDDAAYPIATQIETGRVMAAVGFRQEHESDYYYLPSGGLLAAR